MNNYAPISDNVELSHTDESNEDIDYKVLLVDYRCYKSTLDDELEYRYKAQDFIDEILIRTGQGYCWGGAGMNVECFVIDINEATKVLEQELKNTPFSNYKRIVEERVYLAEIFPDSYKTIS